MDSSAATDCHALIPTLLRLPIELLSRILLDVLAAGQCNWLPDFHHPIWGFPLHKNKKALLEFEANGNSLSYHPFDYAPINGILYASKRIHHESLTVLAHTSKFLVHVDVREDTLTGVNAFREIQALSASFRNGIKRIVLFVSFLTPRADGVFLWDEFLNMMDPEQNPLMFEKIVENVNELLHWMPGVEKMHLVWRMFFGNGGLALIKERYTRQLWERLGKEWPGRDIQWSAQTCMGSFDDKAKKRS